MIKVKIKNDYIEISGHSGYDEFGKDIICASASSIAITSVNAILKIDKQALSYQENDGYLKISILKHSKETDTIILNMIDMLKELEKQYKNNIKIYEEVE